MLTTEQQKANDDAKKIVDKQIEFLKQLTPPRPTPSLFEKPKSWLYSRAKVQDMMYELVEFLEKRDIQEEFDAWLSDKGMNNNNNENEDLYPEFLEDLVNSFIN